MTRDERIEAGARAIWAAMPYAEAYPRYPGLDGHAQQVREFALAALDAALADLGGLGGLALDADDDEWQARMIAERDDLRADRDRLREALSLVLASQGGAPEVRDAERALRDSEASDG